MEEVMNELSACKAGEFSAFSYLSTEALEQLSAFFACKQVAAGETLWVEGDPCDYLAFITGGKVQVKKETEFKGRQVVVGILSKGAVVGELCVLDGSPRAVTAEVLEDVSLAVISRHDFEKIISAYPEIGTQLMKGILLSVSKRLKSSFERLKTLF